MLFKYEDALGTKGIGKKDLPDAIQDKIRKFNGLCRKLNESDDEDYELQTTLNTEIEELDAELVEDVKNYTPAPEDPKPEDPKPEDPKPEDPKPEDPKPEEESGGITFGHVLGFGVIAVGVGFLFKKLMGK